MIPHIEINDGRLNAWFDAAPANVRAHLLARLTPIASDMRDDAKGRAAAHIRYTGKYPGQYLDSIQSGVSMKHPTRVTGYIRSGFFLARLLETGFNITDIMIYPKRVQAMLFEAFGGKVFAKAVHRHATRVEPYPAIRPAYESRKAEIIEALIAACRAGLAKGR